MKFLGGFVDFAVRCIQHSVFVALVWSTLIAIGVVLYIQYLESIALRIDGLRALNRIHVIAIVLVYSVLWIIGLLCTFSCMILRRRDASSQGEVSTELRRSCEDLAEKNAELARFVYTVSHDLKSPLVTIKGYIGLMLDNIQDGSYSEVQQNAITINRAADKMQQLLDELLGLSRIGRVCGDYVCKPINEIIGDALLSLNGICDSDHPEIVIQPDMPQLCGDTIRLSELLQNLIENAIKYVEDQDDPHIEISAWVEDNKIVCCVSDNGIGIEEAYLEKIFDLFEKLDPDTPGSGVGLAVAKRIVEVHHGRIWCESEGSGKGSKFYFSIPRASCEPA